LQNTKAEKWQKPSHSKFPPLFFPNRVLLIVKRFVCANGKNHRKQWQEGARRNVGNEKGEGFSPFSSNKTDKGRIHLFLTIITFPHTHAHAHTFSHALSLTHTHAFFLASFPGGFLERLLCRQKCEKKIPKRRISPSVI
jgi:hypothetical protein